MPADSPSSFELLQGLLHPPPARSTRLQRLLPTSGTLANLNESARQGHRLLLPVLTGLRSLAQVIFINNPISGALLLLAFLLESPWMAVLAVVGTAGANLTSRGFQLSRGLRHQGIHGFNGALVGCAAAVLVRSRSLADAALWLVLVLMGSAATTVLLEAWGRRFHGRGALPPLTFPFCVVTWVLLAMGGALPLSPTDSSPLVSSVWPLEPVQALLLGLPRSFGQVFLCSTLGSGLLVLLAVALASPLAAALGLFGAFTAMVMALLLGASNASVAQGLWGYNGVLVAIALGGIFHAPTRRSLLLALGGAALTAPGSMLMLAVLPGLPALTLDFVLTTWMLKLLAGRTLPALMPVCVHAVLTPEEHRERYRVARHALSTFRTNLRHRHTKGSAAPIAPPMAEPLRQTIGLLFDQLDADRDGSLSLAELRAALTNGALASNTALSQLDVVVEAMDVDGDGRVDRTEFTALIERLQRLRDAESRLLLYLMPADADGDDRLDPVELGRLLRSIDEPALTAAEEERVFGISRSALTWRGFVDRLLLT